MNVELPQHLKATAALLSRSLRPHPMEAAPPIPKNLISDLAARVEPTASVARISWIEQARSFIATPSFGLAAAALLVIGFIAPALMTPSRSGSPDETFRGATVVHTTRDASIVLITDEPETRLLLEQSGLFDMGSVIETSDPLVAASIGTAKLLVDVKGGAMIAYNAESREVLADELPEDRSQLAERIALAFGALQ